MLVFTAGLMVGGIIGVFIMCIITVAGEAEHPEECEYEVIEEYDHPLDEASTTQGRCR